MNRFTLPTLCEASHKTGKTASAVNIAYILNKRHNKRVLLIDNDKQGNTSKFFKCHDYSRPTIAEVLTEKDPNTLRDALRSLNSASEPWLDLLPANMNLLRAEKEILLDVSRAQQTRLKRAIKAMKDGGYHYDYAVIDCAPDLNMGVINAIVAADDILIPIKIDSFALDGVEQLLEQIEETRDFNPNVRVAGGFITMYTRNNVNTQGAEVLNERTGLPMFKTVIRKTVKVDETTFTGQPLIDYAPKCTAAKDYEALVAEYLAGCSFRQDEKADVTETSTNERSGQNAG